MTMASGLATTLVALAPLVSHGQIVTNEAPPDANTVILWHLNEGSGTTAADAATALDGANNGTITANTTWTTGRFGSGLNGVAGDSGYVSATLGSDVFTNQQFTVGAWVRPTAIDAGGSYIMTMDDGGGFDPYVYVRLTGSGGTGGFGVRVNSGGIRWAELPVDFGTNILNEWHHIAVAFKKGVLVMYLDGVALSTNSTYLGMPLGGTLGRFAAAGDAPWNPGGTGGNFIGDIDEIRVSNFAPTIPDVVFSGPTNEYTPDANTVILWHLNEGSGTTAADAAPVLGGANDGTLSSGATVWTTSGRFGNGLVSTADYTNGYLGASLGLNLFTNQQFTMDAWIKPTAIDPSGSYVMGLDDGIGGNAGAFLRLNPNPNTVKFGVFNVIPGEGYSQTDLDVSLGAGVNVTDGTWRHIAVTYSNQTMTIFLNGVPLGTKTTPSFFTLAEPVRFNAAGNRPWNPDATDGYRYMGDIDEIRVSNIARTDFGPTSTPAPPTPAPTSEYWSDANTVILWHLNEGSGTTTADAAPVLDGANNGTLSSGATVWTNSGRFGNGLVSTADYTNGYLGTPVGLNLFTNQQFTMDVWIKPTAIDPNGSYVMGLDDGIGGNAGAFIRLNPDPNTIKFGVFNVISGQGYSQTDLDVSLGVGVSVLDGTWRHIAATYSNQTLKVYLNGVMLGSTTTPGFFTLAEPVRFNAAGNRPWNPDATDGYRYMGFIDEIRVSNIARTGFATPTVSIVRSGNNVVVTYAGILQSASAVTGPYTDVVGTVSPFTNSVSGAQKFFRSRGP